MPRTYHVTVQTPSGRTSFVTPADNGVHAITQALSIYPDATKAMAKPINTSILG